MENIIIGKLSVEPWYLFALDKNDWNYNEKDKTLFTDEKFIPRIMVQAGIVAPTSEVQHSHPDLAREVKNNSFEIIKWERNFCLLRVENKYSQYRRS